MFNDEIRIKKQKAIKKPITINNVLYGDVQ